jgi:hypothetical protein
MLVVAHCARAILGDDRARQTKDFLLALAAPGGGFRGPGGSCDLYYTLFAADSLRALESPLPADLRDYLLRVGDVASLDLIHLACLARAWTRLAPPMPDTQRAAIGARLAAFESADGGYHTSGGARQGSIYGCFLGLGVLQDTGGMVADPARFLACVRALGHHDGSFVSEPGIELATTNATVGGILLLRAMGEPVPPPSIAWLVAQADETEGGFRAGSVVPIPDLVSTATALFALHAAGHPLDGQRESCLAFVESLWSESGGFRAFWTDDAPDSEHTFYGLLSLGCLAETPDAAARQD